VQDLEVEFERYREVPYPIRLTMSEFVAALLDFDELESAILL
jgi:hypothetical protein